MKIKLMFATLFLSIAPALSSAAPDFSNFDRVSKKSQHRSADYCKSFRGRNSDWCDTHFQTANILDISTLTYDVGAVSLVRDPNSVNATLNLIGLDPVAAYTTWWVIVNNPEYCEKGPDSCGMRDIENPMTEAFISFANGFVTGSDGIANVTAELISTNASGIGGLDYLVPGGLSRSNGLEAAIQIIIKTHGPIIPGMVSEQTSSYDGACDINECAEVQYVAFPPISK